MKRITIGQKPHGNPEPGDLHISQDGAVYLDTDKWWIDRGTTEYMSMDLGSLHKQGTCLLIPQVTAATTAGAIDMLLSMPNRDEWVTEAEIQAMEQFRDGVLGVKT